MTHKPLFFLFLIPLVVGYFVYLDYENSKKYCVYDDWIGSLKECYRTKHEATTVGFEDCSLYKPDCSIKYNGIPLYEGRCLLTSDRLLEFCSSGDNLFHGEVTSKDLNDIHNREKSPKI